MKNPLRRRFRRPPHPAGPPVPPDIIYQIATHLVRDGARSSLATLLRVSKDAYDVVLPLLYERVEFTWSTQLDGFLEGLRADEWGPYGGAWRRRRSSSSSSGSSGSSSSSGASAGGIFASVGGSDSGSAMPDPPWHPDAHVRRLRSLLFVRTLLLWEAPSTSISSRILSLCSSALPYHRVFPRLEHLKIPCSLLVSLPVGSITSAYGNLKGGIKRREAFLRLGHPSLLTVLPFPVHVEPPWRPRGEHKDIGAMADRHCICIWVSEFRLSWPDLDLVEWSINDPDELFLVTGCRNEVRIVHNPQKPYNRKHLAGWLSIVLHQVWALEKIERVQHTTRVYIEAPIDLSSDDIAAVNRTPLRKMYEADLWKDIHQEVVKRMAEAKPGLAPSRLNQVDGKTVLKCLEIVITNEEESTVSGR